MPGRIGCGLTNLGISKTSFDPQNRKYKISNSAGVLITSNLLAFNPTQLTLQAPESKPGNQKAYVLS